MSQVYQRGSIRRVTRARGNDVWEWRYRVGGKQKQQKFLVENFPTEKALWRHLATSIEQLNAAEEPTQIVTSMGSVISRYRIEVLPELARSTRGTDGSMLKAHIEPEWKDKLIADVRPMAVNKWLKTLKMSDSSRGRARRLMKQLLDKAMYWEFIPQVENPMDLVKVKGSTKRTKKIVLLTPTQVGMLIDALSEPYSVVIMISAFLGLRIEETSALQWSDFDMKTKKVIIRRAWTHGEVKEVKTPASEAELPVPEELMEILIAYQKESTSKWLFPSKRTTKPRWTGIMLQDHIQPVAKKLGLPHIGFHTFRHSYRAWLGEGDATLSQQKELLRHSSIGVTLSYGGSQVESMRPLVNAVAKLIRQPQAKPESESD